MRWAAAVVLSGLTWAQADPAFEVASVKRLKEHGLTNVRPFGTNKFIATSVSFRVLIGIAFGVSDAQIAGPDWLVSEHYDVSANAADGVVLTRENVQPLLRRLLEERLALKTHREMKETNGYELVVAREGSKLKPTAGISGQGELWVGAFHLKNAGTDMLATILEYPAGRPVVDKTGLSGKYDIDLEYAPPDKPESPLPSVFTAIQEKLGLKLEPKRVPFETLVIDHAERTPTEN